MSSALTPPPAQTFRAMTGTPVVFAGIVAVDEEWRPVRGSFANEAAIVFERMDAALASAGLDRYDIVSARCYLAEVGFFVDLNTAWTDYFGADAPPRTTIGAILHPPFRLEIEIMAETSKIATDGPRGT